jgi:hypothetical protein
VFEVGRLAISTGLAGMRASGDTLGDRVHFFTFQDVVFSHELILSPTRKPGKPHPV